MTPKKTKGPAEQIEQWPLERLKPFKKNARVHSADQVAKIAKSIREFGFVAPVIAQPDGTLIAGHGRILAAHKAGIKQVPVLVVSGWSADKISAYVLADNKIALDASWDDDILRAELAALSQTDFDVTLTGFNDAEILKIIQADLSNESSETSGGGSDADEEQIECKCPHCDHVFKASFVAVKAPKSSRGKKS